jgi:hypothetical protein
MPRSRQAVELVSPPSRSSTRRRGIARAVHEPLRLAEFRREVIRLGAYLGWAESDVARFAERLTGRAWRDCDAPELGEVARSYAEIATRIQARLSNGEG